MKGDAKKNLGYPSICIISPWGESSLERSVVQLHFGYALRGWGVGGDTQESKSTVMENAFIYQKIYRAVIFLKPSVVEQYRVNYRI